MNFQRHPQEVLTVRAMNYPRKILRQEVQLVGGVCVLHVLIPWSNPQQHVLHTHREINTDTHNTHIQAGRIIKEKKYSCICLTKITMSCHSKRTESCHFGRMWGKGTWYSRLSKDHRALDSAGLLIYPRSVLFCRMMEGIS